MRHMTMLNFADFRNNLANILESVTTKKQPVTVGKFGEPKAVLVDITTYNWQKQVVDLVRRIEKLTSAEIKTLNILLDDRARNALFAGLEEAKTGKIVSFADFLKD